LDDQVDLLCVGFVQEVLELAGLGVVANEVSQGFAVDKLVKVDFLLVV
jgi:hypothetical protein